MGSCQYWLRDPTTLHAWSGSRKQHDLQRGSLTRPRSVKLAYPYHSNGSRNVFIESLGRIGLRSVESSFSFVTSEKGVYCVERLVFSPPSIGICEQGGARRPPVYYCNNN